MRSKKRFKRIGIKAGIVGIASILCMACGTMTAYAKTDDTYEGGNTSSINSQEEYEAYIIDDDEAADDTNVVSDDEASMDVEWQVAADDTGDGKGILTPTGNLTLVDDIDEEQASENLQYMTVTTKGGDYFYIIVDRSGSDDNVYFLNAVDAADLMALMDEDTQEKFNEAMAADSEEEETETVLYTNTLEEDESVESVETEEKSSGVLGGLGGFAVVVFIVGGIAAGYYFLKIKPGKNKTKDEDLEFFDDEDYEDDALGKPEEEDLDDESNDEGDSDTEDVAEDYEATRTVADFSDESVDD